MSELIADLTRQRVHLSEGGSGRKEGRKEGRGVGRSRSSSLSMSMSMSMSMEGKRLKLSSAHTLSRRRTLQIIYLVPRELIQARSYVKNDNISQSSPTKPNQTKPNQTALLGLLESLLRTLAAISSDPA